MTETDDWDDPQPDTEADPHMQGILKGMFYMLTFELAIVGAWFIVTQVVL